MLGKLRYFRRIVSEFAVPNMKAKKNVSAVVVFLIISFFGTEILAQSGIIRYVSGSDFIFIVKADGSVSGFGNEEKDGGLRKDGRGIATPQPLAFPGKVKQIESGYDMHFALLEDGAVLAWGMNDRGQFGRGPGSSRTPENPLRSSTPIVVPLPKDVVQIDAGRYYGLAVRSNGAVVTWGEGPASQSMADVAMKTLDGLPPVSTVSAGGEHALALTRTGEVYAWGRNMSGELGLAPTEQMRRSKTPIRVAGLDGVISISCEGTTNFGFSGAVKSDGTVWMWGSNQSATMGIPKFWGNGGPAGTVNSTPEKVVGLTNAKSIVAGPGHIVVRLADNTLRIWGHDGWGQVGIGTSGGYHPSPKKPAIANVLAAYVAGNRTFAVKSDGTLWWWGVAPSRLGGPYGKDGKVPTQVFGF